MQENTKLALLFSQEIKRTAFDPLRSDFVQYLTTLKFIQKVILLQYLNFEQF